MKISPDYIKDDSYKCYTEALKKELSDESARREIARLYQKNSFYSIKDSNISDRNGGRGFELQGDHEKSSKFDDELKKSSIGKEFSKCEKSNDSRSHQLKALELKGEGDKASTEVSLDITINKSEEVNIPSDAGSLKELLDIFDGGYSGN